MTRAREPDTSGFVERDGVRIAYEVFGSGEPTVLLLPTWSIIHSRHWKMQIPYLARHCRVLTFDGRGNGGTDRPPSGYGEREFAADALAVMDATGTERAALVSLSMGAQRALVLAGEHPDRVEAAVFLCPSVPLGEDIAVRGRDWSQVRPRLLAPSTATSSSSSSPRCSASRIRRSRGRTASGGGSRPRRRC